MKLKQVVFVAVVSLLMITPAWAAPSAWNNSTGDTLWATPGNWTGGLPVATSDVTLGDNVGTPNNLCYTGTAATLTINSLTFSSAYNLSMTGTSLLVTPNIIVAPSDGNAYTYTLDSRLINNASVAFNVGSFSTINASAQLLNMSAVAFSKSGNGTLNFSAGGALLDTIKSLTVTSGTVSFQNTSGLYMSGPMNISAGAAVAAGSNAVIVGNNGSAGDSLIQGYYKNNSTFTVSGPGDVTLSGAGQIYDTAVTKWTEGRLILDETGAMLSGTSRISGSNHYLYPNKMLLKGNDTALTAENFTSPDQLGLSTGVNTAITIQHGSSAGANAFIAFAGALYNTGANTAGMLTLYAQDKNGVGEELGTPADMGGFATSTKDYFFTKAENTTTGVFTGVTWTGTTGGAGQAIFAQGRAGAYTAPDGTFMTSEFLTQVGTAIYRYAGVGRQSNINLAMSTTTRQVSNFEIRDTDQVVAAGLSNYWINSLKLTNAGLDLGGQTLGIGSWNQSAANAFAQVNQGAGIIVTGTLRQSTSLSNGTIVVKTNAGNGNSIYLTNDNDFEVNANATLQAKYLVKTGTGLLKLSGPLRLNSTTTAPMSGVYWLDGSLEYNTADDMTVSGNVYGAGKFIKDGSTTVTLTGDNFTTGGVLIHGGIVKDSPAASALSALGSGTTEVDSGASLIVTAGVLAGPIVVHDGGLFAMAGGSSASGGTITMEGSTVLSNTTGSNLLGAITAKDTSYINGIAKSWNMGDVTLQDNATGDIRFAGIGNSEGFITLSNNANLRMTGSSSNPIFAGASLSDNSRLISYCSMSFANTVSLTGSANFTMVSTGGASNQANSVQGALYMDQNSTGTGWLHVSGAMVMKDYAAFTVVSGINGYVQGSLTMSGSSNITNIVDQMNIGNDNPTHVIVRDDALLTTGSGGIWQSTAASGAAGASLTTYDRAIVRLNMWHESWAMTSNDYSTIRIYENQGYTAGTITGNGHSHITVIGDTNLAGAIAANDYSYVEVGGNKIAGPITADATATLRIGNGVISADINSLSDSQVTWGGGSTTAQNAGVNALILTTTVNVSGSKTFTVKQWDDPAYVWPYLELWNVGGTGDLVVNGAAPSGLSFNTTMGSSLWTGNINVQSGVMSIRPNSAPAGLGTISLAAGTKLFLSGSSGASAKTNTLVGHTISGLGTVTTGDYLNLPDGSGKIISAGGTWKPGGDVVGTMAVQGDLQFAMNDAAAAQLVIKGASGPSFDLLPVSRTLTGLDSAGLVLNIARNGWASYVGATMTIVTATNDLSATPHFATVTWQNHMIGQVNYNSGSITLTHVGLEGDGNNDGSIDATDYADWFNNVGGVVAGWGPGDFNGDAAVDASDYALWFNNVGASAGSPVGAVPEPATMTLLVLGGLAILRRRK